MPFTRQSRQVLRKVRNLGPVLGSGLERFHGQNAQSDQFTTLAETYRSNAQAQWLTAEETSLPSRREMHERSALAWEQMADSAEDTASKASVNAAAKYG